MLKRKQRVTSEVFSRVLKKGKTCHSDNFTLRFISGTSGRAAVIVSKKIAKTAVSRNTIKRKVRSALVPLIPNKSLTILVYTKKGAAKLSVQKMGREFEVCLKTIDVTRV